MLVRMEGRILLRLEQHVQGLKAQIDGIDRSAKDVSKELRAMLERILLAQAGEHFRSGDPSEPALAVTDDALDSLTPRKRDVAVLIRSGMSNYCISQHLRITENTVKTHVSQLLKHFGMSNRTKLAAFLLSHQ
jgi:DNA-binding NarL/FixJ family response regulator